MNRQNGLFLTVSRQPSEGTPPIETLTQEYMHGPTTLWEAQQAVSDVLGQLRFDTAAFCGWYDAQASEATIFKTGRRMIQSPNEFQHEEFMMTALHFSGQMRFDWLVYIVQYVH